MVKLIVVVLSVLLSFSLVFSRPANNESIDGTEAFISGEGATIFISFEHYQMQEGWTPVVLSIGELNCLLWMNKEGKVSEPREPGAAFIEPVCIIDAADKSLRKEEGALFFDIYEQNNIRTRWRLSSRDTAGTVTPKILSRGKSGIELCLGTLRLQLKHAALDIKEFSPGLYHVQFHGLMMVLSRPMIYEKAAGKLYSDHQWNNKLIHGQNQNRPQVAGPKASAVTAIPSLERAALIALYNSTNGDSWTNKSGWKTPPLAADGFALPGMENTWYGITCGSGNTTVQVISLDNKNLNGTLPPELGNLANLQVLSLSSNQLSGPIPPELENLANLQWLDLDDNQLSGLIPPELGNLANLQDLYLGWNQLNGTIPPELGNLANLRWLYLFSNQLSGSIPRELGNLANLRWLVLGANQLSGAIPPELGNLANLQYLDLCGYQLSGAIPPELGNLANLQYLYLCGNQLSGSIPPQLANLANLQGLYLGGNQLSGSIPPQLANLAKLQDLDLCVNQLSGAIPPELGNLAKLQCLFLYYNQLSGPIPPELGNLANLNFLYLDSNNLSGTIPPELGNLANLRWFLLNSNQLSGSIPSNLINLGNLENGHLALDWNALYTNDYTLKVFLNSKHVEWSYWENTQTIAPSNVTAAALSISSIDIHWTPIAYKFDTGGYRVFYSTTPGGPYTYSGMTANKSASSLTVSGLNPGVTYYFVVQTRTNPHGFNRNTVDSEYSVEVSAATLQDIIISGTVTFGGSGLQGVTITPDNGGGTAVTDANGNYSATVPNGWSGTAIPSKTGYDFTPASRIYTNVTVNQTNQDYLGSLITGLTLTSPNGGESWGLNTIQNITWTSAGLVGNIRLELWKAGKKLGVIAANIPISNGTYAWFVGSYGLGIASTGSDYKVKIMTANGLYNDTGNAAFSIVQPSLTLTSPRGNESWKLGTLKNITWTPVGLTGNVKLLLFNNGVQVGVIARGIPVTNGTYAWTVGKSSSGLAPTGGNYTVKIRGADNPSYSSGSSIFNIL